MAYVDQSGLILIDEIEAAEDILKLKKTIESMNEALKKLNEMESINSVSKGDAADTVDSVAAELIKQVNNQKLEIEQTIKYINELIEKYRTIDANMKNQINTSVK